MSRVKYGSGKIKSGGDLVKDRLARTEALFEQTREFFTTLETAGALPSLEIPNLILQTGEFAILHQAETILAGYKTREVAVEERTIFAGIPVYPLVREIEPAGVFGALAEGNLYLTNHRLLYLSDRRVLSIPWLKLLSAHPTLDSLQIAVNDSETPFTFSSNNALLWAALIKWFTLTEVKTPQLGPKPHFTLGREVAPATDAILFTFELRTGD